MVHLKVKNHSEFDFFFSKYLMSTNSHYSTISNSSFYSVLCSQVVRIRPQLPLKMGNRIVSTSEGIPTHEERGNSLNEKIINLIMIHGKKAKAFTIFYKALNKFENKLVTSFKFQSSDSKKNLVVKQALFQAIENVKPSLEVRKVRVARMTYHVPAILTANRQENLAIRWLLDSAKKRKKMSKMEFAECLSLELFDAFHKQGGARKKRDELHKFTEINRAYSRYRWW